MGTAAEIGVWTNVGIEGGMDAGTDAGAEVGACACACACAGVEVDAGALPLNSRLLTSSCIS